MHFYLLKMATVTVGRQIIFLNNVDLTKEEGSLT